VVTDHIIPHRGDTALLRDPNNWQPSCAAHHDIVKQRLELLFGQGKITVDDLRLDSVVAKAMTIEMIP